jgi:hypothetical protein
MSTGEVNYIYSKKLGWHPEPECETYTVVCDSGLVVTLLARKPEPGEYFNYCLSGDREYAPEGKLNLETLANKWCKPNMGKYEVFGGISGAQIFESGQYMHHSALPFTMIIHED